MSSIVPFEPNRKHTEFAQIRSELEALQGELARLREEYDMLLEFAKLEQPIVCNFYVQELLMGSTDGETLEGILEYLGLTEPGTVYNVLYLCTYRHFDVNVMQDAICEYLGDLPRYYSAKERTYSLLLSCPADKGGELLMQLNSRVIRMHNYLLDTHDIWLYAGLGQNTDDPVKIRESYRQAVEAASYTYRDYILYPYEFLKKTAAAFYYPPELSSRLVRLVAAGAADQVAELFATLYQENMVKRSLPAPMQRYLLSEIRNSLVRTRLALPESTDAGAVAALDEQFGAQVTFQLCEDLAQELCRLFSTRFKKEDNLATTIEKYIQKHFSDPTLGLVKISEEFGISKTYFSHMFKEKTGVNFSTYLENVRMNEAVRLIREGKLSDAELCTALGYTNLTTFRRAFKKVYGLTPNEFVKH